VLTTSATVLTVPAAVLVETAGARRDAGVHALEHLVTGLLPAIVANDRADVGVHSWLVEEEMGALRLAEDGPGEPGAGEQSMGEHGADEPGVGEPGVGEPGVGEPGVGEPGVGEHWAGANGVGVIAVFDRQPGSGFAVRAYERADVWLTAARQRIEDCACEAGCPACILAPGCGSTRPLDKDCARRLLAAFVPAPTESRSEPAAVGRRGKTGPR
jgi:hypothetical protein